MQLWKSTFKSRAAILTPWQADTLWGHLCWHIVHHHGEERLTAFLRAYEESHPPILLSDGFPGELLPRPLLPPPLSLTERSKKERLERASGAKALAKTSWLTRDEFERTLRGETVVPQTTLEDVKPFSSTRVVSKNWVKRTTGTSGDPFDVIEISQPQVTIYWRIADDEHLQLVREFLDDLTLSGYGKRKTGGYGAVDDWKLEACDEFSSISNANGFVTLSRFVPATHDPTEGFWNVVVKYGKLGESLATSAAPFKQPLLQIECGSCFRNGGLPRPFYGRLVSGIHVRRPEIKHYGFAFAVPLQFPTASCET